MSLGVFTKDPAAILDFVVDWTSWLAGDTLATATATIASGATITSQSNTTTAHTIWISGGTNGASYTVTCTITTAGGRTDRRTFTISVASN